MMINWPATPSKVEAASTSASSSTSIPTNGTVSGIVYPEIRVSAAKGKSPLPFNVTEPSPASTYGETAAGDSVPTTPGDSQGPEDLVHDLSTLQLDSSYTEKENRTTTTLARGDSNLAASSPLKTGLDCKGPSRKSLTPSRYRPNPAISSPGGVRRSPGSGLRRRGSIHDTNWRTSRTVSFALPSDSNDPFYEENNSPSHSSSSNICGNNDGPTSAASVDGSPSANTLSCSSVFRPREDREVVEISGENAQALFPPNSCVFVANLVQGLADEQLEYSVTRAFEQFGKVYVKIKRDPRGMPYAFCQYEKPGDSENAIKYGRGLMIDGRQCRTERAKVNRSLYLTRITGGAIAEAEAREILRGRGDLEKLWIPSPTEKEMFRLGEGIWVMFAFFQDCRDAQALFKDNPKYRLEAPHHPEEVQSRGNARTGPSPNSKVSPARRYLSPPHYRLRQAERSSVFVGNLPQDINSVQLQGLLSNYGAIRSCEVVSRPVLHGLGKYNVFAYIEFSSPEEARRVSSAEHTLNGSKLRVELRESSDQVGYRSTGISAGSPHPRRAGVSGAVSREMAMARALAAGIDTSTVMQIFTADPSSPTNQAGVVSSVFPQMQYQNYYTPVYPQYGPSPTGEGHVSHYPYAGGVAPHFYTSFATTTPYTYPNSAGAVTNAETGSQN